MSHIPCNLDWIKLEMSILIGVFSYYGQAKQYKWAWTCDIKHSKLSRWDSREIHEGPCWGPLTEETIIVDPGSLEVASY